MKILYLHQYFVTPAMAGGTRSYEMARRLVDAGHEVHVITSDRRADGRRAWRTESVRGITVHWYPVSYENGMTFTSRVWAFLKFAVAATFRAVKVGGDVVFASSTPLTIALPAVVSKRALRVPMVFEVRDLWPEMPIAVGALKNPIAVNLARWLERWAYRNSDRIVALSPGMAAGVVKAQYPSDRVTVIPNASDLDLFGRTSKSSDGPLRAKAEDGPIVLYAGTFGLVNDVAYLVRVAEVAMTLDSEVRFVVMGSGAQENLIRQAAESCGVLGENFSIEAPLPKEDMPAVLATAAVCLSLFAPIPEMEANSANKFFDALAAGRPVVINYGGWQEELLKASGAGIRISRDPATAARQIVELVSNPDLLTQMGTAARELAADRFSRDDLASDLMAVLTSAVNADAVGGARRPNGQTRPRRQGPAS